LEFLGNEVSNFEFSTDIEFYSCNIIYWKQRLLEIGISLSDKVYTLDELNFCDQYLIDKGFHSGPIFPLLLYVNRLIDLNNNPLRLLFLILIIAYIFLANKVSTINAKNWKYINSLLLLFSPILIWLTLFPSTDLLFSVFWLFSLYLFKKYIENKNSILDNFYNENLILTFSSSLILIIGLLISLILYYVHY